MKYLIITAGLCLGLLACNTAASDKRPEKQNVTKYQSKEIGWTITVPQGYEVSDNEELKRLENSGKQAMESSLGRELDISGLKDLANFRKDRFNQFQSSMEPFDTITDGNWYEHDQALKLVIYTTFRDQGIHVDSSATEAVTISGMPFRRYTFTIYSPDNEVILRQEIYNALIKGYTFGAFINFNDSTAYQEMLQAWQSSVFQ